MGGSGSGGWVRCDKKGTVEDHQCLDVRVLYREHGIKPDSEITLKYQMQDEQVVQEVMVDWTPCNFGGHRPWLICLHCGRRVAVLYLRGKYFACRHCLDLTYQSCQESDKRFSRFLRNNEDLDRVEDLPLWALKGLLSRHRQKRVGLKDK